MKDQLQMLLELQKLDLEVDEIRSSKDSINEDLQEANRVLARLRDDLEEQGRQLEATIELQKEKDRERADLEERYKKSKSRLAKVTNSKEYSAVELEIENTKRLNAQVEEDLLQLLEVIEATQQAISEKGQKIEGLTTQIGIEGTHASERIVELDNKVNDILESRNSLSTSIRKDVIRRYAFIRSRRDGVAIVPARDGYCQGCYMQLPPQLYNEIQRCNTLHFCPSCQRILFFESETTAEEEVSS